MIELLEQALAAYSAEVIKRAEAAEKHLRIAEKALVEKDELIAVLKRGLDKRDAKIKALEEQLANQTSTEIVDVERDKKIKELEGQLTIVKNVNEKWKNIHTTDQVRITKLEQTIEKYASTLKRIEGTLCAASDHFKEISNSIHTIVK